MKRQSLRIRFPPRDVRTLARRFGDSGDEPLLETAMHVVALVIFMSAAGPAAAAEGRTWKLERQGVTFELTAADLRAWTGDTSRPPAFSMAALLAAEKKEFDDYAKELAGDLVGPDAREYPDYGMTEQVTFEVLSVVGTLVSWHQSGGGDTPGTAHPSGYDVLVARDVRRKDATPSLLDFYPESQIVAALKADPFVRKFGNPDKGFERATSLQDLVASLDSEWALENSEASDNECGFEVSFDPSMVKGFYFHHVAKDRVAVRLAVAPGNEMCNRIAGLQQIGLLLPIPEALRDDLLRAERGEAGFLAGNRKAFGSPTYSDGWEVDIRTLARKGRTR